MLSRFLDSDWIIHLLSWVLSLQMVDCGNPGTPRKLMMWGQAVYRSAREPAHHGQQGWLWSGSPAPALGPLSSNKGDQVPLLVGMRPLKGSPCLTY